MFTLALAAAVLYIGLAMQIGRMIAYGGSTK
jgi:hypothetical protein